MKIRSSWLLLAALVCSPLAGVRANLIINPSFESIPGPLMNGGGTWGVFGSIQGWTSTFGSGIEIQQFAAGSPFDGNRLVELDSHSNSNMKQLVGTTQGDLYTLSFMYSPRPGVGAGSNGISVFWNGSFLDSITASGIGNNDTDWEQHNYLVSATGDNTWLKFKATGTSDSYGGYLDLVSLEKFSRETPPSPVPEPTTMALTGLGLAGLGLVRRKSAKK